MITLTNGIFCPCFNEHCHNLYFGIFFFLSWFILYYFLMDKVKKIIIEKNIETANTTYLKKKLSLKNVF